MARIYKGRNAELERWTIANSQTLTVGDFVMFTANNGIEAADAVTNLIYGILEGFTTPGGVPLNQANTTEYDGTYTAASETYASASDNETDKFIQALVRPVTSQDTISVLADAAIGTTTGSDKPGYYISVLTSDSTKVDENTAHVSNVLHLVTVDNGQAAYSCQDPQLEGNNILVKVVEAEVPRAAQA